MDERIAATLHQNKDAIVNAWHQWILNGYSQKTALFLRQEQNQFANPISYAFREAIESMYSALIEQKEIDRSKLDYAVKIKATQCSDPLEGTAFIFIMKQLIRETLGTSLPEAEFQDLESRVDQIGKTAEEMFIANRAKIAQLAASCRKVL
jgi:hypothetical protein